MPVGWSPCARCPEPVPPKTSLCPACTRTTDQARRPHGNPYHSRGHQTFRRQVLAKNPICVICLKQPATVADHHPTERADLITQGLNPNDPDFGRGLCASCHSRHTAQTRPAGWNANQNYNQ